MGRGRHAALHADWSMIAAASDWDEDAGPSPVWATAVPWTSAGGDGGRRQRDSGKAFVPTGRGIIHRPAGNLKAMAVAWLRGNWAQAQGESVSQQSTGKSRRRRTVPSSVQGQSCCPWTPGPFGYSCRRPRRSLPSLSAWGRSW